jgi:hypothetical protein
MTDNKRFTAKIPQFTQTPRPVLAYRNRDQKHCSLSTQQFLAAAAQYVYSNLHPTTSPSLVVHIHLVQPLATLLQKPAQRWQRWLLQLEVICLPQVAPGHALFTTKQLHVTLQQYISHKTVKPTPQNGH